MAKRLDARFVKRFRWPAYPTKLEVLTTPELLKKHQPPAWLSNRELAAAAGVFLAANAAGCGKSATDASHGARLAPDAPAIVAPILRHGEGLGATGCIVISPPSFLSEEEAFQVIASELSRHGIELSERNVDLETVIVKGRVVREGYEWVADQKTRGYVTVDVPLSVDGLDPEKQVAVEFTSARDYFDLDGPWQQRRMSTAYNVETLAVACSLAGQVAAQPAGLYFGVFYDPLMLSDTEMDYAKFHAYTEQLWSRASEFRTREDVTQEEVKEQLRTWEKKLENDEVLREWRNAWDQAQKLNKGEAQEVLREQVRDFVDWLKAQGVI
jgi:hypothetical protein